MKERGIVYVSTGTAYKEETLKSARSVKAMMPNVSLCLFTDAYPSHTDCDLFDYVKVIKRPRFTFVDKIGPLISTPFQRTVFLDTDTIMLSPIWELFELLEHFELAYCHAPYRHCPGINNQIEDVPDCFAEANTGVLVYRISRAVKSLFKKWERIYSEQLSSACPPSHDQPAFRKALYTSAINAYVLPPEYNTRTPTPFFKGEGIPVKILHGRDPSLAKALNGVDRNSKIGIYDFSRA